MTEKMEHSKKNPMAKNKVARLEAKDRQIEKALAKLSSRRRSAARKGGRKTAETRARREKEMREAARADQPWNIFRRLAPVGNAERQMLALPAWQVLIARMDPGRWYRFGELVALMPEYAKGTVKAHVLQNLPRRGLIEREENPDFDPSIPEKAMASGMYRYRMAGKAVSLAVEWRKELGIG